MRSAGEIAFLRTVELGSVRAAARALGQDPSGISRRITQLEQRLGTKLVVRSGNATKATAQGQAYYLRLKEIIDQLEALEAEVSGEVLRPTGLLRVTASIDFGQEFLTPWLLEFRGLYPDVEFDLVLASGFVDMNQNNIDVALRTGQLPDSSLVARKLAEVPRVLVASKGYVARHGAPKTAAELANHQAVFFVPGNRTRPLSLKGPDGHTVQVKRTKGVSINAIRSAVAAVQAGHGIHSGPLWAFSDLIDRGDVEVILPDYSQEAFSLYAVRQPSVVVPARIAFFIRFLREKVRDVKGLDPVR